MITRYLIFILFITLSNGITCQDIHFSQFNLAPLNLNPAMTGSFNGDYRFVGNLRNQWSSVTVPYKTFAFSVEKNKVYNIALTHRKGLKKTTLYINNRSVTMNKGKIKPRIFTLGGGVDGHGCKSQFRNVTVYRSCKRADQIKRLFNGIIGYSSLIIFSPLDDGIMEPGLEVNNLAPDECRFILLQK